VTYPEWFAPLAATAPTLTASDFRWQAMPDTEEDEAAVLVLFAAAATHGDVLLIQRPAHMRAHAGQPAFPGGRVEAGEDAVAAALREAGEEVGLDSTSVTVVAALPQLWLPPSRFKVTPVLAWWHEPHPLQANPDEVGAFHRVPITEFTQPSNRLRVTTRSGFIGPAFRVHDMLVWGFTGGVLSRLLDLAGWSRPWDDSEVLPVPESAQEPPA
jgi:8-oxo-dGTP pyrophosphatase MutT (NUDIX family)